MTDLPAPGSRGPRRGLTEDEGTVAKKLNEARELLRRADELAAEAEKTRGDLASRCADLNDVGLSVTQIAKGLGISRQAAQRLIEQGRK